MTSNKTKLDRLEKKIRPLAKVNEDKVEVVFPLQAIYGTGEEDKAITMTLSQYEEMVRLAEKIYGQETHDHRQA